MREEHAGKSVPIDVLKHAMEKMGPIGVKGNEEFLDKVALILVQQIAWMQHEEAKKLQDTATSDSNGKNPVIYL